MIVNRAASNSSVCRHSKSRFSLAGIRVQDPESHHHTIRRCIHTIFQTPVAVVSHRLQDPGSLRALSSMSDGAQRQPCRRARVHGFSWVSRNSVWLPLGSCYQFSEHLDLDRTTMALVSALTLTLTLILTTLTPMLTPNVGRLLERRHFWKVGSNCGPD